jgi:hypothetical protein
MSLRSLPLILIAGAPLLAYGQASPATSSASIEERLRRLEERQGQLEDQVRQKDARIEELERQLGTGAAAPAQAPAPSEGATAPPVVAAGADLPDVIEGINPARDQQTAQAAGTFINPDTPLAPGRGFEVGRNELGSLNIGAYALIRVLEQLPADQETTDHLGRPLVVDTRQDANIHRIMLNFRGFAFDPKLNYALTVWTVNATESVRVIGSLGYTFSDAFTLSAGVSGTPGTRSMLGSHPFWLGHDRTLADEYFRPGFSSGIWASGQTPRGTNYKFMVANNISTLGVNAVEDTRDLAYSGTLWWMPTTGEYGPQGAWNDFEFHEELATRFGISYVRSPREDRTAQPSSQSPDSTQIRVADSLLLFELDALGDGVTVQTANYELLSMDFGFKFRGFFLQTEAYYRTLNDFRAADFSTVALPVQSIREQGFYVQGGFFPVPRKFELYASTSRIYADGDAGFDDSRDVALGANWYWSGTRYQRLNLQYIDVKDSPASSTFGYFTGGLDGQIISLEASVLF